MLKLYQFEIENSDAGESYLNRLKALQEIVAAGNIGEASKWHAANMVPISFIGTCFTRCSARSRMAPSR